MRFLRRRILGHEHAVHWLTHCTCPAAVGMLAAHCAFFKGAGDVVLIDHEEDRLQFARDHIPNIKTINFDKKKVKDCSRQKLL